MYKLKSSNGRVNFLLKTGNDFVRSNMSVSSAQHMIDNGETADSDRPDYPICVNGQYYFEGEEIKPVRATRKAKK